MSSSITYDDWESAADAMQTSNSLQVPNIPSSRVPPTSWDDEEADATMFEIQQQQQKQTATKTPTTTSALHKAPTKNALLRKAQEDADLRIAAEMLGSSGELLAPAELPTSANTLVDVAAFTKYGTTMCEHLHGLTTGAKVPAKHLMAFYRAVVADAAKHLAPEDLLLLGQAVDAARNEKLRAAKAGAKAKPAAKAAAKKIYVGRDDDIGGAHDDRVGDFGSMDDY
jgi:Translation initiation factor eIF3 subunit